jgi:branched-chain amino acid transport system substrate-binding protein
MKFSQLSLVAATLAVTTASAAPVKIGFITTLTTPAAVIGKDMQNSVNLAMEHLGGKAGSTPLEVIFADDGFKPDVGKQASDRLVKQENVDFVAGYIWSHVLLASQKSVLDSGKFLISANAGPSPMAGKLCHKNFFSSSWQNDQTPMALGEVMNQKGVKSVYIMMPNYAASMDMIKGFERTFKGKVVGKDLTKWGADAQLDFSAELAKARASKADAIYVFYPGAAGPAFLKQYQQAGLNKVMPLYTTFTVDAISLPRLQKAKLSGVLGSRTTQEWDPTLDNPANKRFVADYRKKFGVYPSYYGAQAYDAIMLIASAVKAVGGDVSNPDKVRAALKAANFDSVRGSFRYNSNHFPIQNFYLREFVPDAQGNWSSKVVGTVFKDHADPYVSECKM